MRYFVLCLIIIISEVCVCMHSVHVSAQPGVHLMAKNKTDVFSNMQIAFVFMVHTTLLCVNPFYYFLFIIKYIIHITDQPCSK